MTSNPKTSVTQMCDAMYGLTNQLNTTAGLPEPRFQNASFCTTWAKGHAPTSGKMETQEQLFQTMQDAAVMVGRQAVLSGNRVAWWQLGIDSFPAPITFP